VGWRPRSAVDGSVVEAAGGDARHEERDDEDREAEREREQPAAVRAHVGAPSVARNPPHVLLHPCGASGAYTERHVVRVAGAATVASCGIRSEPGDPRKPVPCGT
jgi:hypothetical protein